ncbi:MAG TPA: hypothetical protein VGT07_05165, partial [Steroidobacteraceae bacterium]|nr:hypothetical protein [Steroidobacteraceae bacterium]
AGTHGPAGISGDTGNPKDRASAQVTWSKGALTVTPSMNFIGHFTNTDPSAGVTTCDAGLGYTAKFLGGATPANSQWCNVKYFLETNLYASYQVSGDFEVHASVDDLFNKTPPVDMMTYGSGTNFYPYDAALEQDGAVGRFFTIGMTYQFE